MSAAAALVIFTQAVAGLQNAVTASNSNDTNVKNWVWSVDDVPRGSTVVKGPRSTNSTMTFTPDMNGNYLITLQVLGTDGLWASNSLNWSVGSPTRLAIPYLQNQVIYPTAPTITVCNGEPRRALYTITVPAAAWSAAATTKDITLLTPPAKSKICSIICDTTAVYDGAGTCAITVGNAAGDNKYIVSHDVKSALITVGLADADFGSLLTRAGAINGGSMPAANWTASSLVSARMTSGTGNTSAFTVGSTTFYVEMEYFG